MVLTKDYSRVAAHSDYSGWITPEGKFLRHVGSHSNTLRMNKIDIMADEALSDGYIWLLDDSSGGLYVECDSEVFPFAKQEVEKLVGSDERIERVYFDIPREEHEPAKSRIFRFDSNHVYLRRVRE